MILKSFKSIHFDPVLCPQVTPEQGAVLHFVSREACLPALSLGAPRPLRLPLAVFMRRQREVHMCIQKYTCAYNGLEAEFPCLRDVLTQLPEAMPDMTS